MNFPIPTAADRTECKIAKATVYTRSEFLGNIVRTEVRDLEIKRGPYAQYASAVTFTYVPKGARSRRGATLTYRPYLVVIEGWGHFDPKGAWTDPKPSDTDPDVEVRASRYTSCDERWGSDFDAELARYLDASGAKIAADFRNVNTYEKI